MTEFVLITLLTAYQLKVNPDPTLKLGYELPLSKPRRELFKHTVIDKKYCPPSTQPLEASEMSFHDEDISQQLSCSSCQTKDALIKSLGRKINHLNKEISMLKKDKLVYTKITKT